jgi:hypothetical protein
MLSPEELLEIELEVVAAVVGTWTSAVATAHKAILALIAGVEGNDMSEIVPEVEKILNTLEVPEYMNEEALAGLIKAHIFGAELTDQADDEPLPKVKLSKSSRKAVEKLREGAQEALDQSKENLSRPLIGGGAQSITTAVAPVIQSPAKIKAATAWAVNAASNSAVAKIAKERGINYCWIPERDGCVHCTAYAGVFSDDKGVFPPNLTYGKKPLEPYGGVLNHPPLHPHCRCHIEIGISQDYADALKREAVRSILKGFAMDSESEAVRVDAAKRLLATDPVAPASVKKYAAKSVKDWEAEKAAKKVKADSIEGKDFRSMTNAEKLKAAETMYGKNSKQYKEALRRFGKK